MFTEFIPAFGFFILIILLTQRLLRKYIDQPSVFILASFVLYIAGIALVHFDTTQQAIKTFIALFAGDLILHTFGILSYFPIFIIGLVWGANKHNFRDNSGLQLMVTSVVMLFIVQVTQATSWERWPPSLLFLLFGLSFSLIIVINREFWQKTATLLTPITYIGQHAFYFYVLHLAILLPISSLFISKTANFSISVGMVFICLISAYLIQYFLHRTTKNH
ncbi:hypothetical protein KC571_03815 [candidate division WWE3 bacterium]|uniref:Acyltransferase 3 domain-containing protein n=1 Tax=candidate division WWE3 bacterium TaxID=2053526 RepID=A0A955RQJ4_UNCKA|nr:hypothetical protein [candidate division WWE3 bacterium]